MPDPTMTEWDTDLAFALSCASLRYTMGRSSYAVSSVIDAITKRLHLFTVNDLARMAREIDEENARRVEWMGESVSALVDRAAWLALRDAIDAELARRDRT